MNLLAPHLTYTVRKTEYLFPFLGPPTSVGRERERQVKPFLEQQNIKKLYGSKNNCACVQLGQIMGKQI